MRGRSRRGVPGQLLRQTDFTPSMSQPRRGRRTSSREGGKALEDALNPRMVGSGWGDVDDSARASGCRLRPVRAAMVSARSSWIDLLRFGCCAAGVVVLMIASRYPALIGCGFPARVCAAAVSRAARACASDIPTSAHVLTLGSDG